jgi:hypothetical protein
MTAPRPVPAAPRPVVHRSPDELRPHPMNSMPRWNQDSDAWLAFVEDIRQHGIRVPLQVTARNEVVDGETRRLASVALGLAQVPCVIVSDEEVTECFMRELLHRRNLTKGQRAYLALPHLDELVEVSRRRRAKNVQKPQHFSIVDQSTIEAETSELIARRFGFSRDLFFQAKRLHEAFAAEPDLRDEFEPKILDLDDPIGLGACLAGIAGRRSTKDQEKRHRADEQLELFSEAWTVLGKRFDYWTKLGDDDRRRVVPVLRQTVAAMPYDLRVELRKALTAADKEESAARG